MDLSLSSSPIDLTHIRTWIFDLDNTLYPPHSDLWPKIDARILLYISQLLGLDGLSSRALQKFYYQRYGTTLHGLMQDYAICAKTFLEFVHDIDRSSLKGNEELAEEITHLPGQKFILTNGSYDHAQATLKELGLAHLFNGIFDILEAQLAPKPGPLMYERFCDKYHIDPQSAAMFEDLPHNLRVPHALGMTTILVVPEAGHLDTREPWEKENMRGPHIHFITQNLAHFLKQAMTHTPV